MKLVLRLLLFVVAFLAGCFFAFRVSYFHERRASKGTNQRLHDWHARHHGNLHTAKNNFATTPTEASSSSPPLPEQSTSNPPPNSPPPNFSTHPPLHSLDGLTGGDLTRKKLHNMAIALSGKSEGSIITLTFANSAFLDLLLNWVATAKRAGVEQIIVGAMDQALFKECEARQLPVYSMDDDGLLDHISKAEEVTPMSQLGQADFRSDHKQFRNMGAKKAGFALALLQAGYSVLISDVDAVFVNDARVFFNENSLAKKADIWVSTDCLSPTQDKEHLSEVPGVYGSRPPNHWWRYGPRVGEQNGNIIEAAFNTGILYFAPTNASKVFVKLWIETIFQAGKNIHDTHVWDDQQAFNNLARMGPAQPYYTDPLTFVEGSQGRVILTMNQQVRLGLLPLPLFSNGHSFFLQRLQEQPGTPPTLMVHNTYQYHGTEGKEVRFRHFGLWHADPDSYYTQGNFVTYSGKLPADVRKSVDALYTTWREELQGRPGSPPEPGMASHFRIVAHHLLELRNLFAIAKATNRIPIIPPLECHCDRYWYPIVNTCRSPGSELGRPFTCTLDMLFPMKVWRQRGLQWRADSFLTMERVPAELRASQVNIVVGADEGGNKLAGVNIPSGSTTSRTTALPEFLTDIQLRDRLHPVQDVRVWNLSSASKAFCAFESVEENTKFDELMRAVLQEIWCCHNNGSLAYDNPQPLVHSKVVGQQCIPPPPPSFPQVDKAREIEMACPTIEKCMQWNTIPIDPVLVPYGKFSEHLHHSKTLDHRKHGHHHGHHGSR